MLTSDYNFRSWRYFKSIARATKKKWRHLYENPYKYLAFGHLRVWKKRSVMFILSYDPENQGIFVHGAVADQVNKEKVSILEGMLRTYNAAHKNARARLDSDHLKVFVESTGKVPAYEKQLFDEIESIYKNLNNLINDKTLQTILKRAGARFLGAPIDLWDDESL